MVTVSALLGLCMVSLYHDGYGYSSTAIVAEIAERVAVPAAGEPAGGAARGVRSLTLAEKLAGRAFLLTAELDPPRGADPARLVERARQLKPLVDAVNITDCPLANVRMGAVAAAHLVQREAGVEAIVHVTCRDRNQIGLRADLLGAHALGIRHVLVLHGDPPAGGNCPEARGVYELDTPGLVRLIAELNGGRAGCASLEAPTSFLVAVAANPAADDREREVERLAAKVEAGGAFVQTQPVFEAEDALRFQESCRAAGLRVPILYGIMPLRDLEFARRVAAIPGVRVPERLLRRLQVRGETAGVEAARELARELAAFADGIHVFPMGRVAMVAAVAEAVAEGQGRARRAGQV